MNVQYLTSMLLLFGFCLMLPPAWGQPSDSQYSETDTMDSKPSLTTRQQAIVPIAAFAAAGQMDELKTALNHGLDAELTENEIKEVLVQLYAYAGFPRSLNALGLLMEVRDERRERGINDEKGTVPTSPIPQGDALLEMGTANQTELVGQPVKGPLFKFAPAIDDYLKTHLFGDIFARDNLNWQDREIATIGMLAAMSGVESQLKSHLNIGINAGLTREQLQGIADVLAGQVNSESAILIQNFLSDSASSASQENWDKTFPRSAKVDHQKVTFKNRYGITLTGDLYQPKNSKHKQLPAIAVCGPFGAVKEQASGLYAQTMAERGFVTLAFDPSYTGESSGEPRHIASPDINTEDFSAAVDFLGLQSSVDRERIGIIGICGWGGFALNATAVDKRIKAVATSTMYDMSRLMSQGYNDSMTAEQQQAAMEQLSQQRWIDAERGTPALGPVSLENLTDDVPQFVKEYAGYYKTERGFHPRAINSNSSWTITNPMSFINAPLMTRIKEISPRPLLLIHGEKAHSRYFSETAYSAAAEPKELLIIEGANHVDLYDQTDVIPFNKLETFFQEHLASQKE